MLRLPVVNVSMEMDRHHREMMMFPGGLNGSVRDAAFIPSISIRIDAIAEASALRAMRLGSQDIMHSIQGGIFISSQRTEGLHQQATPNDAMALELGRLAIRRGLNEMDILGMSGGGPRDDYAPQQVVRLAEAASRSGISLSELQANLREMSELMQRNMETSYGWPTVAHAPTVSGTGSLRLPVGTTFPSLLPVPGIIEAGTWDLDALNRQQAETKQPILAIGPRKLLLP